MEKMVTKKNEIMAFNNVYAGKKVLITGNTGFKGSWLSVWLTMMGADVYGYALDAPTNPSMFKVLNLEKRVHHQNGDIRDKEYFCQVVQETKPDFIFHLAAQAIVATSYREPFDTLTTNVVGTAVVLESIKNITWKCVCVLITSDKAYDNVEWIWGYRESDSLGGKDVYSGSKGAAELTIKCYWESFIRKMPQICLGVARAGNVIGGGDWAADRIVVDCIKAFTERRTVEIRSPFATRPWQHVLEPLSGYLALGQSLFEKKSSNGEVYNFGPRAEQMKTVFTLAQDLAEQWGLDKTKAIRQIDKIPFNEATLLKLNCDKALANLNWHSTWHYEDCVQAIVLWYKSFYEGERGESMYRMTISQIETYMSDASKQELSWVK